VFLAIVTTSVTIKRHYDNYCTSMENNKNSGILKGTLRTLNRTRLWLMRCDYCLRLSCRLYWI